MSPTPISIFGAKYLVSGENPASSGRRWTSLLIGLVSAGVIVSALVVAFFVFGGGDKLDMLVSAASVHPHESTAEWVSDDAIAYTSVNLRPGLSELLRARRFFENLVDFEEADQEFEDSVDELSETLGTDLREGVFPVLGPEIAVALYGGVDAVNGIEEPDVIIFVGFLDMEVGKSLLESAVVAARERGESVEELARGEQTVYFIDESGYAMAHESEPYLLLASSEETLDQTLSMMAEPVNPLSENEGFIAAMERLPENRFASGYMDISEVFTEEESVALFPFVGAESDDAMAFAGAVTIGKKDLRFDYVTRFGAESYDSLAPIGDSLNMLPSELIGFFGMGGLGATIDTAFGFDENVESQQFLSDAFEQATGLDLMEDVMAPLGDEFAVALVDLKPTENEDDDLFSGFPEVNGLMLIEIDDMETMRATLDSLLTTAEDSGLVFNTMDINGVEAWGMETPEGPGLAPIFMFLDNFLVAGLSVESLEIAQGVASGDIANVRQNDSYDRIIDTIGDDSFATFFIDAEALGATIRAFMTGESLAEYDERYAPWFEKIDAFAMTSSYDGEWAQTTGLLTLN